LAIKKMKVRTKKSRGIARIYDVLVACIIVVLALGTSLSYLVSNERSAPSSDLHELASQCLAYMDRQGVLAPLVYSESPTAQLQSLLSSILPPNVVYSLTIYNSSWTPLLTVSDGFVAGSTASAYYYIGGFEGHVNPRIIVLTLSGE